MKVDVLKLKPVQVEMDIATSQSLSLTGTEATPGSRPSSGATGLSQTTQLSNSSRIGIGVGVGVGGAILLAIIGYLALLRRARNRKKRADARYTEKPELDGQETSKATYAHEAHDGPVHELEGTMGMQPEDMERSVGVPEIEFTGSPVEAETASNVPEMEARHGMAEMDSSRLKRDDP